MFGMDCYLDDQNNFHFIIEQVMMFLVMVKNIIIPIDIDICTRR